MVRSPSSGRYREKLHGRTLAISAIGGVDDTTTRLVLHAQGIAASDLHVVALGDPSARAAALVAGHVATTISIGTWSIIGTSPGARVLVSPEAYFNAAPLLAKVDAVTASTLASFAAIGRSMEAWTLPQLQATADILYNSAEHGGMPRVPASRWTDLRVLDTALQQLGRM